MIKNNPPLLSICYIEAYERFAFLGFLSIFVFYLMDFYGFSKGDASLISASFGASIYSLGMLGSLLGDFCIGAKRGVIFGLMFLSIGYLVLAFDYLVISLFCLIFGSVLIKSNISNLLAKTYPKNTDYAFSVFYIFVNIGCFLGQFIIGFVVKNHSYYYGFWLSFFAIICAIFVYFKYQNYDYDKIKFDFITKNIKYFLLFIFFIVFCWFLSIYTISKIISFFSIFLPLFFYIYIYKKTNEKSNFRLLGVYFAIAIILYFLIFQSFNTLNILTNIKINNNLFGYAIPSTWYVSFMFFSSIFLSIILSKITKNKSINEPLFIGFAMLLAAIAFIMAGFFSNNLIFVLLIYFLLGIAQLIIGAIGISVSTKLAPKGYETSVIGVWFLCSAAAQGIEAIVVKSIDFVSFEYYFATQGIFTLIVSLFIIAFNQKLKIRI